MTASKDETCEPDLDRLAEAWIALCQTELAALAADPQVAAAWHQALRLGTAWLRPAPPEPQGDGTTPAAGTPAAGAAPGLRAGDAPAGEDPAGLRARLEQLERRLAALERGSPGGEADRRRPRRKRAPA